MNEYLVEHLKRLFLLKYQEFLICLTLSALFIFLILTKSNYAFSFGMINFIIYMGLVGSRKFLNIRAAADYRYNEVYLLPLKEKELFQFNFMKSLIFYGPSYLVIGSCLLGFMVSDFKVISFFNISLVSVLLVTYFILSILRNDLSIHFKKNQGFLKLIDFTRHLPFRLMGGGGIFASYCMDIIYKHKYFVFTFLTAFIVLGVEAMLLYYKRRECFFNEHIIHTRLKFRPVIDVPAFLFMFTILGLIFWGAGSETIPVKIRKPATINAISR